MKRILIVDDSRVSRKMIRNTLEQVGFEVVAEAINGKEGLELYDRLSPDVVLMDVTMPEMNGIDALRVIREKNPQAKVVIMSANGQSDTKMQAIKAGAETFITKPFEDQEIIDAINNC